MTTAIESPPPEEPAPAPPSDPTTSPAELAEMKEKLNMLHFVRGKIKTAYAELADRKKKLDLAKKSVVSKEDEIDQLNVEMYELIDGPGPQTKLPFPPGGITQGATPPMGATGFNYADGPWRDSAIDVLELTEAVAEKIKAEGCHTVGKLVDKAKAAPEGQGYRCIKGIGEKSAGKISDAVERLIMGKPVPLDPSIKTDTDGVPMIPPPGQMAAELEEDLAPVATKYDYATTWPTVHNPERIPEGGVEAYIGGLITKLQPLVEKQVKLERCLFKGLDPTTGEKAKDAVRNGADMQGLLLPIEQDINGTLGDYAGYFSWDDAKDLSAHVKNLVIASTSPDKK